MYDLDGFLELEAELGDILNTLENVDNILESGAKLFVDDLLKLPKPMSNIRKAGYTHLVNTFGYRKSTRKSSEIEVGWGKY